MATIEVKLKPFDLPVNAVIEGSGEIIAIEDLPDSTFKEMVWDWIHAMEKKSGVEMYLRAD